MDGYPLSHADLAAMAAFQETQRALLAVDVVAMQQAAQLQAALLPIQETVALHDSVMSAMRASIDLPRVAEVFAQLREPAELFSADVAAVAHQLASAVDISALAGAVSAFHDAIGPSVAAYQATVDSLRSFDFSLLDDFRIEKWLPGNLVDVEDTAAVATVALDEGIPLAWVPRREIVIELLAQPTAEARFTLIEERFESILDDCESALSGIQTEWAEQARQAVRALRGGHFAPAQSHAGNILDSIVLAVFSGTNVRGRPHDARREALRAGQESFDEVGLSFFAEHLVLRSVVRALTPWYPGRGTPPPTHFARHATAHAVGEPSLFTRRNALVAVMLATSLAIQYGRP